MSFVAVTHNETQSTSPTHQTSESKASSAEKKHFLLGNLTKFKWFNKTKDVDNGGSVHVPLQTRPSTQQSDGRCQQKSQHHGRHSPTDLLECVDRIEEDVTLTIKVVLTY